MNTFILEKLLSSHGNLISCVSSSLWDIPLSPDLSKTTCWEFFVAAEFSTVVHLEKCVNTFIEIRI